MPLQQVRSSTANKRPVATNLADGQLALNYHVDSPGIFFKDSNNTLVKAGPVHVGTTAPNVTPAGSSGNSKGECWLDTSGTNPVLKVWNGTAWVTVNVTASNNVVTTGDTGTVTSTMIANGTIVDADVNASAAIAGTKVSPSFGSQAISTTGTITGSSLIPTGSSVPANGVYLPAANTVGVASASTERIRITSTGVVLVGTTAVVGDAYSPSGVRLFTLSGSSASFGTHRNDNTAFSNAFIFTKARGTALETVQSNDTVGILTFQAANGTAFARAAGIEAYVDGTPSSTSMPGRLSFFTTPAGSNNPTERLRLSSAGDAAFYGTGATGIHVGTTAQRPGSPSAGMIRLNTSLNQFEGYNGTTWGTIGGGAKGGGADQVFFENDQTVTTDYTMTSGKNAVTAGPVTINNGITVTVPSGSVWSIV